MPDAVVLSGDLTLNGEKGAHEALAGEAEGTCRPGVRVLVIPGNHDINNPHAASYFGGEGRRRDGQCRGFLDIYHEFGYDQAISRDETSLSYICRLDEKNWLMMLDSAQYDPVNLVGGRIRKHYSQMDGGTAGGYRRNWGFGNSHCPSQPPEGKYSLSGGLYSGKQRGSDPAAGTIPCAGLYQQPPASAADQEIQA